MYRVGKSLAEYPFDIGEAITDIQDPIALENIGERLLYQIEENRSDRDSLYNLMIHNGGVCILIGRGLAEHPDVKPDFLQSYYDKLKHYIRGRNTNCGYYHSSSIPGVIWTLSAVFGNPNCPVQVLEDAMERDLLKDSYFASTVAANPGTPGHILRRLFKINSSAHVRENIAANSNTYEDILLHLAGSKRARILRKVAENSSITLRVAKRITNNDYILKETIVALLNNSSVPEHFKETMVDATLQQLKHIDWKHTYPFSIKFSKLLETFLGIVKSPYSIPEVLEQALLLLPVLSEFQKDYYTALALAIVVSPNATNEMLAELVFANQRLVSDAAQNALKERAGHRDHAEDIDFDEDIGSEVLQVPDGAVAKLGKMFCEDPFSLKHYMLIDDYDILCRWKRALVKWSKHYAFSSLYMPVISAMLSNPSLLQLSDSDDVEWLKSIKSIITCAAYIPYYVSKIGPLAKVILSNPGAPRSLIDFALSQCEDSQNPKKNAAGISWILAGIASSPNIDTGLCLRLLRHRSAGMRKALASNPATPVDILRRLANSKIAEVRLAAEKGLAAQR